MLADFPLDGEAPSVDSITLPASFAGVQPLSWSVSDPDGSGHTYWVDYSADGGDTWVNLAMNLEDAGLAVDFDSLPASDGEAVFRVIASDGVNSGELVSAAFTVGGKAPHGEIVGPSATAFHEGQVVVLEAAAWDVDDGALDDGDVTWSSSHDGALGTGAVLAVYDLSLGSHTITMTARDSDDNEVTDSISITVSQAPTTEGEPEVLSGDINCSGAVDSVDGLGIARFVAGLTVGQTQPCPAIGSAAVFGDVNCDDTVTAVDSLFVLRHVAGLPVNLPGGCREIGT